MHHSLVQKYLEMYAKHFDLLKYIQFNTEVIKVRQLLKLQIIQTLDRTRRYWLLACFPLKWVPAKFFGHIDMYWPSL